MQLPIVYKLCIECCSLLCLPFCKEPNKKDITDEVANRELAATDSRFCKYLETDLGLEIKDRDKGCLLITVECSSREIQQRFYEEYTSGRLNRKAEDCLVTKELLETFGLKDVKLRTTIHHPAEYKRGRWELIKSGKSCLMFRCRSIFFFT